jgi:hypothetical protein
MDLKSYYLEYKNIPWYYGTCTQAQTVNVARAESHALWRQMCMKEPINLTIPALNSYEDYVDDEDDEYD